TCACMLIFYYVSSFSRSFPSFPTRRSSDLTKQMIQQLGTVTLEADTFDMVELVVAGRIGQAQQQLKTLLELPDAPGNDQFHHVKDRKSTRLNSSHVSISYAVFCLKKKKRGI